MIDESGPVFEAWQDTVGVEGVGPVELRMAFDALKYGYTVGWEKGHDAAERENAALRAERDEAVSAARHMSQRMDAADDVTLALRARVEALGSVLRELVDAYAEMSKRPTDYPNNSASLLRVRQAFTVAESALGGTAEKELR